MIPREHFPAASNLIGYPFHALQSEVEPVSLATGNLLGYSPTGSCSRGERVCHLSDDNELQAENTRYGAEVCQLIGDMTLEEDDCA